MALDLEPEFIRPTSGRNSYYQSGRNLPDERRRKSNSLKIDQIQ